ncbi:MAG: trypsin-like peptidase domain-containing protein [Acidobacteria bacterium]|nr:trypsin-like peptidase domain-containing protein [Acidobacteriota bacterium]
MKDFAYDNGELLERYRRSRQRAILIAVAACFLAAGVILGVALSRQATPVRAGDKEVNSELASAFVEVSRQVEPAVVNISTVVKPAKPTRDSELYSIPRPSLDSTLPYLGGDQALRGNGSGVIVDPQGYILTNRHVVNQVDRITVRFFDGTELPARLIGSDAEVDLAVVKVDPVAPLTAIRFGDSEKMRVGDWVLAIGSPFGLDQTVTAGIISAKERDSSELYKRVGFQYFLQTDAAINRGNSGGPLVNLSGELIGINSAIATSTGDYNGICFALPSMEAIGVYRQLVKNGRVVRGFLGAMTERVTPQIAKIYHLPVVRGAIISNVGQTMLVGNQAVESPAAKAGLKLNDVVIEFRGERIKDDSDLIRQVAATPVGTTAPIKIFRDGKEMSLTVVVSQRPEINQIETSEDAKPSEAASLPRQNIGISVQTMTPTRIIERSLGQVMGVLVIRVEAGSVSDDAGLKVNDVIEAVNRQQVKNVDDFKEVLSSLNSGEPIVLQVYRQKLYPNPRIFISFNRP